MSLMIHFKGKKICLLWLMFTLTVEVYKKQCSVHRETRMSKNLP